jgi:hypothetical protein
MQRVINSTDYIKTQAMPVPQPPVMSALSHLSNTLDTASDELSSLFIKIQPVRSMMTGEASKEEDPHPVGCCEVEESLQQSIAKVRFLINRICAVRDELRI